MPALSLEAIGILLLILPGFIAYRFAIWRRADSSRRSVLWQLSEMLEYSVYVHLLGVALAVGVHFLLQWLGVSSYARVFIQDGPDALLKSHFTAAVLWFTLYPVYVIFSSAVLGAYDVPGQVSAKIVAAVRRPAEWLAGRGKLLAWFPVPKDAYPQEPVWYHALGSIPAEAGAVTPLVIVRLKSGDVYFGQIVSYPIVPDTARQKDFLIRNARYYPKGDPDAEQDWTKLDDIGAVLLDTANVDSIVLYYANTAQQDTEPPG